MWRFRCGTKPTVHFRVLFVFVIFCRRDCSLAIEHSDTVVKPSPSSWMTLLSTLDGPFAIPLGESIATQPGPSSLLANVDIRFDTRDGREDGRPFDQNHGSGHELCH